MQVSGSNTGVIFQNIVAYSIIMIDKAMLLL